MKLYQITCPSCGANICSEEERKILFCTYCGQRVYMDDEIERIEITENINVHKKLTDEGKIKEIEYKSKELEYKERERKWNDLCVFAAIGVLAVMSFIFLNM